ncbi:MULTISPECIES: hypothetical protein [Haloferax]|uniref:Uncharacterized protein n=1 Tax=Haloferax massiliensis TaxID=1476858 RepID=A0A0D6JV42_9EURY|nr:MULTISPECIES: hypothetical protein [Haloferax]MDS0241494.1 hypothetical protein [Haloferax sp. S2CR25]MDS0444615.1 hypothetical protein [Haloferax sp. S2CR25-2]CQR51988.1 hypothetical protein BN996_02923 [Haloferax massiliensis]
MSLRRDVRHGLRIGRAEFVRSLRGYASETRRIVGLLLLLLFFGGSLLFSLPVVYVAGRSAQSVTEIPFFDLAATGVPVALAVLATFRTLERIGRVEHESLVLTTVHPRAVVIGLIAAEIGRVALWFGLPFAVVAATFTAGLGAPSLLVTAALVVVPLACCTTVWGYAAGIAVLRAFERLPGVRRILKVVGFVATVAFVLVSQSVGRSLADGSLPVEWLAATLAVGPLGDYLALAFVGTPLARPFSAVAVATFAAIVALTPVGLVVATRQASALWFTDRATGGDRGSSAAADAEANGSPGGFSVPRPLSATKGGRVAWGLLVRGVRHPQKFTHLVMLAFFLGPLGTTIVQSSADGLGPLLAASGAGLGTYLAGATFGLNPLGDDRPQFPLLLLTATAPRALVRGRVLAGVVLGVPVAAALPLLTVALGTSPLSAVGFALVGVFMCVAAAAFAVGIGAAYPIYEEREFWGAKTVVPSTLVLMAFMFVVGPGTVIGLVATWFGVTGHVSATPLLAVGLGLYLLVTVGVSYGSYRYAIRRYRTYTFD